MHRREKRLKNEAMTPIDRRSVVAVQVHAWLQGHNRPRMLRFQLGNRLYHNIPSSLLEMKTPFLFQVFE